MNNYWQVYSKISICILLIYYLQLSPIAEVYYILVEKVGKAICLDYTQGIRGLENDAWKGWLADHTKVASY